MNIIKVILSAIGCCLETLKISLRSDFPLATVSLPQTMIIVRVMPFATGQNFKLALRYFNLSISYLSSDYDHYYSYIGMPFSTR